MTTMLDLMGTFHDIDRLKGRVCGRCDAMFYNPCIHGNGCRKGRHPAGIEDGCDDWQPKPDREAQQLAAVIGSL